MCQLWTRKADGHKILLKDGFVSAADISKCVGNGRVDVIRVKVSEC